MSLIRMWAQNEGISPAAVARLEALLGVAGTAALRDKPADAITGSEAKVQNDVRLEAARADILLWRNNVGAAQTENGFVRYGLANESKQMNDRIKSSDLIGIRKRIITRQMVGSTVGVFVARECKHETWQFKPGDSHARAQLTFIDLINSYGGDAAFATGQGTL